MRSDLLTPLVPQTTTRLGMWIFALFFLPGAGLRLQPQGPRRARLRGAPLPHSHNALVATSCSVSPLQAFDSQCGCPQWEVPRVGTPAPEVQAIGAHRRGRVGVPRRKQLDKQPDEAMPSSRGDARAAERARTGGAKTASRRGQRISEQDRMRLTADFRGADPRRGFRQKLLLWRTTRSSASSKG
jgi:hypothetical protein